MLAHADDKEETLGEARAAVLAGVLRALAHPLRLRLVALLCEGRTHVNDLAQRLGVTQAIVSQQLRILRMSRLVEVSRERGLALPDRRAAAARAAPLHAGLLGRLAGGRGASRSTSG